LERPDLFFLPSVVRMTAGWAIGNSGLKLRKSRSFDSVWRKYAPNSAQDDISSLKTTSSFSEFISAQGDVSFLRAISLLFIAAVN
jgi:hypothetical protein